MIHEKQAGAIAVTGVQAKEAYHIDPESTAHITQILTNMYSKPERAVLREYVSNAVDAHVLAGKPTFPVSVWLPTAMEPTFVVRDYGPGLSYEDTRKLLFGYGASGEHKRTSNDYIGGFGVGAKVGFAVARSFSYIIYHEGKKRIWSNYLDDLDAGQAVLQAEEETSEESGMEVIIPVSESRLSAFDKAANDVFTYFPVQPQVLRKSPGIFISPPPIVLLHGTLPVSIDGKRVVVDVCIETEESAGSLEFSDLFATKSGKSASQFTLVLGNTAYLVDVASLPELAELRRAESKLRGVTIKAPIGFVQLAPSREALQYSQRTTRVLTALGKLLLDSGYRASLTSALESDDNCLRSRMLRLAAETSTPWMAANEHGYPRLRVPAFTKDTYLRPWTVVRNSSSSQPWLIDNSYTSTGCDDIDISLSPATKDVFLNMATVASRSTDDDNIGYVAAAWLVQYEKQLKDTKVVRFWTGVGAMNNWAMCPFNEPEQTDYQDAKAVAKLKATGVTIRDSIVGRPYVSYSRRRSRGGSGPSFIPVHSSKFFKPSSCATTGGVRVASSRWEVMKATDVKAITKSTTVAVVPCDCFLIEGPHRRLCDYYTAAMMTLLLDPNAGKRLLGDNHVLVGVRKADMDGKYTDTCKSVWTLISETYTAARAVDPVLSDAILLASKQAVSAEFEHYANLVHWLGTDSTAQKVVPFAGEAKRWATAWSTRNAELVAIAYLLSTNTSGYIKDVFGAVAGTALEGVDDASSVMEKHGKDPFTLLIRQIVKQYPLLQCFTESPHAPHADTYMVPEMRQASVKRVLYEPGLLPKFGKTPKNTEYLREYLVSMKPRS